jgi:DNA-binding SARP family transcriptional activator
LQSPWKQILLRHLVNEGVAMLTVRLFGKFQIERHPQILCEVPGGKPQELLCYLMLHRHQVHPRETLAVLLWPDCEAAKSKKYLRQVLWQLQLALQTAFKHRKGQVLSIKADSILMDGDESLRIDVDTFEKAYDHAQNLGEKPMDPARAQMLHDAVSLYCGDLLEGCYQDWCLLERERLQNCYLSMLDRLVRYCLEQGDYQHGVYYGERVLRLDRAHERSHQQMMRLHYQNGDRTAALRQFERCRTALQEELGVEPCRQTIKLYEEMRVEQEGPGKKPGEEISVRPFVDVVDHLQRLLKFINEVQARVKEEIHTASEAGRPQDRQPAASRR